MDLSLNKVKTPVADYSKGKIYKILANNDTLVYYGSTGRQLCERFAIHRYGCKHGKMPHLAELFNYDDVRIVPVEDYPCSSRKELNERETWWIENNPCINRKRAYVSNEVKVVEARTKANDRYATPEIKARYKEYYQAHKEQKREYSRNRYKQLQKAKEELLIENALLKTELEKAKSSTTD
jgi:hypothetical protein